MSGLWSGIATAAAIIVGVLVVVTLVTIVQVKRGEHH